MSLQHYGVHSGVVHKKKEEIKYDKTSKTMCHILPGRGKHYFKRVLVTTGRSKDKKKEVKIKEI